jgi:hypothetical protein
VRRQVRLVGHVRRARSEQFLKTEHQN